MRHYTAVALVIGVLAGTAGCTATVRVYDEPHRDYHRWDEREERAYRAYLAERQRQYREFRALDRREQEEYWQWRHDHPDRR